METQTEPIIILAGTSYPGIYKNEVFAHIQAVFREKRELRKAEREAYEAEWQAFHREASANWRGDDGLSL